VRNLETRLPASNSPPAIRKVVAAAMICGTFGLLSGYATLTVIRMDDRFLPAASVLFVAGFTAASFLIRKFGFLPFQPKRGRYLLFATIILLAYPFAIALVLSALVALERTRLSELLSFVLAMVTGGIFASACAPAAVRILRGFWRWDIFLVSAIGISVLILIIAALPVDAPTATPWTSGLTGFLLFGQAIYGAILGYGLAKS